MYFWRKKGEFDALGENGHQNERFFNPPQFSTNKTLFFLTQSYLWGEIGFPRVGKWVFRENIHVYIPDFIVFYCFCKNYLIGLPCRIYPIFCTLTIVFTSFSVSKTWKYFMHNLSTRQCRINNNYVLCKTNKFRVCSSGSEL